MQTLNYAHRARDIKNKPVVNAHQGSTLTRQLQVRLEAVTAHCEQLQADLDANMSQTGIYITSESWHTLTEKCKLLEQQHREMSGALEYRAESQAEKEEELAAALADLDRLERTHALAENAMQAMSAELLEKQAEIRQTRYELERQRHLNQARTATENKLHPLAVSMQGHLAQANVQTNAMTSHLGASVPPVIWLWPSSHHCLDTEESREASNKKLIQDLHAKVSEESATVFRDLTKLAEEQQVFHRKLQAKMDDAWQKKVEVRRLLDTQVTDFQMAAKGEHSLQKMLQDVDGLGDECQQRVNVYLDDFKSADLQQHTTQKSRVDAIRHQLDVLLKQSQAQLQTWTQHRDDMRSQVCRMPEPVDEDVVSGVAGGHQLQRFRLAPGTRDV